MDTLILPVATIFLAILLLVLFFSKPRIDTIETKIYSHLIIINFIDALLAIIIFLIAKLCYVEIIVIFLQKIYMYLMLLMTVYICFYNIEIMKQIRILNIRNRNFTLQKSTFYNNKTNTSEIYLSECRVKKKSEV